MDCKVGCSDGNPDVRGNLMGLSFLSFLLCFTEILFVLSHIMLITKEPQLKHIYKFDYKSVFLFGGGANICNIFGVALELKRLETPALNFRQTLTTDFSDSLPFGQVNIPLKRI